MRLLWSDERAARTRKKRTVPKWNHGLSFGVLESFSAEGEAAVSGQVIPCREPAWDSPGSENQSSGPRQGSGTRGSGRNVATDLDSITASAVWRSDCAAAMIFSRCSSGSCKPKRQEVTVRQRMFMSLAKVAVQM